MTVTFATPPLMAQEPKGPASIPKSSDKSGPKTPAVLHDSKELLTALAMEDVSYFKRLFSTGAAPDIILSNSGKTLLMEAKSIPLVTLLLENGADPTLRDDTGATALHHAINYEDAVQIIPMLINKGADINAADGTGTTPLIRAVVNDKPDLVGLLLELGADAGIETRDGQTALNWADELGFVDIIEMLEAARPANR